MEGAVKDSSEDGLRDDESSVCLQDCPRVDQVQWSAPDTLGGEALLQQLALLPRCAASTTKGRPASGADRARWEVGLDCILSLGWRSASKSVVQGENLEEEVSLDLACIGRLQSDEALVVAPVL